MKSGWFTDGLDEKEAVVLNAAGALSGRGQDKAIQLVKGLDANFFASETLSLPVSGEKTFIVTTPSGDMQSQLQPALALVERWMVAVEDFVGVYKPQYVLVAVEELAPSVCGTGTSQLEDVPGFVTLNIRCIQDTTVVHELAHIFIGAGPVWFREGAADLVVYHVTGKSGGYLSRSASGKAEPSAVIKLEPGSPEYVNQGAIGADLLLEVYRLIGAERTSSVLKKISSGEWPRETPILTRLFLDATPDESKQAMNSIFANRIAQAR